MFNFLGKEYMGLKYSSMKNILSQSFPIFQPHTKVSDT